MGQRLVINIFRNHKEQEPIASVYLHWSAFTFDSYQEMQYLMQALIETDHNDVKEVQKQVILTYQHRKAPDLIWARGSHGGVWEATPEDTEKVLKDFSLTQDSELIDRSLGLVAITAKGISSHMAWSEGTASLYLDTFTADMGDMWFQSPRTCWKLKDNRWALESREEISLTITEWSHLKEMQVDELSLQYIKTFVRQYQKTGLPEFALTDEGRTVLEAIV